MRTGRLRATELCEAWLERIARNNASLRAFVHLDAASALATAHAIDRRQARGDPLGPLAGLACGVKDNLNVAGMPTRFGSGVFPGDPHKEDAPLAARLRAGDALIMGKTSMPELGMHSATSSETFGVTCNPWDLSCTPGGSSGGSGAAVAAGLVSFATGSDGGGSIRTPAAFCGLVGLKPTTGMVARSHGMSALTALGFLTRRVEDTALLLDATSGVFPGDRASFDPGRPGFVSALHRPIPEGLRIAWSRDLGFAPVEDEAADIAEAAFQTLLQQQRMTQVRKRVSLPNIYKDWVLDALNFAQAELVASGIDPLQLDQRTRSLLHRHAHADPGVYLAVQKAYGEIERCVGRLFGQIDVLATPATACAPFGAAEDIPKHIAGQPAEWTGAEPFSMFVNVTGAPAISVPAGLTRGGLPVGLQLIGRRCEDRLLLQLASLLEKAAPWPLLAPGYD